MRPLAGIQVLTLTEMQVGPLCVRALRELGAETISVELPQGDSGRASHPPMMRDGDRSGPTHARNNFGGSSVVIDYRRNPRGAHLVAKLAKRCDVFAENSLVGSMARFGLDYVALSDLNPRLIYVAISGFGQASSPYQRDRAYGPNIMSMAGFHSTREPGTPPNVNLARSLADNTGAAMALSATLAALFQRERTGKGQFIDVSMLRSVQWFMDMVPSMYSVGVSGHQPATQGVATCFKAMDGYFIIHAVRAHQVVRLAEFLGREDWKVRFGTTAKDMPKWTNAVEMEIRPVIETWAAQLTSAEASRQLQAAEVVASPDRSAEDIVDDPASWDLGILAKVPRADAENPLIVVPYPVDLAGMERQAELPPWPKLGEHTRVVLQEQLGLRDDELATLQADGVIRML